MKPVDYIDKKIVPPLDDISPHNVDEKSELRKSIKKRCRSWVIISFITAVIFAPQRTSLNSSDEPPGASANDMHQPRAEEMFE